MCTVLLPPGGYPIADKYIISYHINQTNWAELITLINPLVQTPTWEANCLLAGHEIHERVQNSCWTNPLQQSCRSIVQSAWTLKESCLMPKECVNI
jgi:hypothetical protein